MSRIKSRRRARSIRYTIRNVPEAVDRKLRARSARTGMNLNQTVIEALSKGAALFNEPIGCHDLESLAGTWVEDAGFDASIEAQKQVDPEKWK